MATERADQATVLTPEEQYEFHIRLHGENIDEKLKDAATSSLPVRTDYQADHGTADESLHRMGPGYPQTTVAGAGRVPLGPPGWQLSAIGVVRVENNQSY